MAERHGQQTQGREQRGHEHRAQALQSTFFDSVPHGVTRVAQLLKHRQHDHTIEHRSGQVWIQAQGVITTIIWSAVVSLIAYKVVDILIGLRVAEDEEREGLDITSHGESAYHN